MSSPLVAPCTPPGHWHGDKSNHEKRSPPKTSRSRSDNGAMPTTTVHSQPSSLKGRHSRTTRTHLSPNQSLRQARLWRQKMARERDADEIPRLREQANKVQVVERKMKVPVCVDQSSQTDMPESESKLQVIFKGMIELEQKFENQQRENAKLLAEIESRDAVIADLKMQIRARDVKMVGFEGDCSKGECDKNACDIQSRRLSKDRLYGPGMEAAADNSKPVTVTTQAAHVGADGGDDQMAVQFEQKIRPMLSKLAPQEAKRKLALILTKPQSYMKAYGMSMASLRALIGRLEEQYGQEG